MVVVGIFHWSCYIHCRSEIDLTVETIRLWHILHSSMNFSMHFLKYEILHIFIIFWFDLIPQVVWCRVGNESGPNTLHIVIVFAFLLLSAVFIMLACKADECCNPRSLFVWENRSTHVSYPTRLREENPRLSQAEEEDAHGFSRGMFAYFQGFH